MHPTSDKLKIQFKTVCKLLFVYVLTQTWLDFMEISVFGSCVYNKVLFKLRVSRVLRYNPKSWTDFDQYSVWTWLICKILILTNTVQMIRCIHWNEYGLNVIKCTSKARNIIYFSRSIIKWPFGSFLSKWEINHR